MLVQYLGNECDYFRISQTRENVLLKVYLLYSSCEDHHDATTSNFAIKCSVESTKPSPIESDTSSVIQSMCFLMSFINNELLSCFFQSLEPPAAMIHRESLKDKNMPDASQSRPSIPIVCFMLPLPNEVFMYCFQGNQRRRPTEMFVSP